MKVHGPWLGDVIHLAAGEGWLWQSVCKGMSGQLVRKLRETGHTLLFFIIPLSSTTCQGKPRWPEDCQLGLHPQLHQIHILNPLLSDRKLWDLHACIALGDQVLLKPTQSVKEEIWELEVDLNKPGILYPLFPLLVWEEGRHLGENLKDHRGLGSLFQRTESHQRGRVPGRKGEGKGSVLKILLQVRVFKDIHMCRRSRFPNFFKFLNKKYTMAEINLPATGFLP